MFDNVCTHTRTHTHTQVHTYSYYPITEYLKWSGMVLSQSNILLLFSRYVKGYNNNYYYNMRGDWSGTCTCTCNPCTYVFHNVGMFSIMQLGPERGGCGDCQGCGYQATGLWHLHQLGNCVLKSLIYSNIKDTVDLCSIRHSLD